MSDHWDDKKQSEDIVLTFRFFMGMVSGYRAAQPPQKVVEREVLLELACLVLPKVEKNQLENWYAAWSDEQIKAVARSKSQLRGSRCAYWYAGFVFGFMLGQDQFEQVQFAQVLKLTNVHHSEASMAFVCNVLVKSHRVVVRIEGLSASHHWLQLEPTMTILVERQRQRAARHRAEQARTVPDTLPPN